MKRRSCHGQLLINFDAPPLVAEVLLRTGEVALIDAADKPLVEGLRWGLTGKGYAATCKGNRWVMLHRLVMGNPPGQVDHKNLNKLDCRRDNLRLCTNTQNQGNRAKQKRPATSKYKGVDLRACSGRYRAQIHRGGKVINLGNFANEEDAARAYDRAAREYFGEFARCNFPAEQSREAAA